MAKGSHGRQKDFWNTLAEAGHARSCHILGWLLTKPSGIKWQPAPLLPLPHPAQHRSWNHMQEDKPCSAGEHRYGTDTEIKRGSKGASGGLGSFSTATWQKGKGGARAAGQPATHSHFGAVVAGCLLRAHTEPPPSASESWKLWWIPAAGRRGHHDSSCSDALATGPGRACEVDEVLLGLWERDEAEHGWKWSPGRRRMVLVWAGRELEGFTSKSVPAWGGDKGGASGSSLHALWGDGKLILKVCAFKCNLPTANSPTQLKK